MKIYIPKNHPTFEQNWDKLSLEEINKRNMEESEKRFQERRNKGRNNYDLHGRRIEESFGLDYLEIWK